MNGDFRVLYLTPVRLETDPNAGVRKKVFGQVDALRDLGADVLLCYLNAEGLVMTDGGKQRSVEALADGPAMVRQWRYYRYVRQRMPDLGAFTHLYIRYHVPTPAYLAFLRSLRPITAGGPFVFCEVPTYPYRHEFSGIKGLAFGVLDRWLADRAGSFYNAVLSFYPARKIFGHEPLLLENALARSIIELGGRSPANPPPFGQAVPLRMIGLAANLEAFHGYDRVLRGLKIYQTSKAADDPDVHFTVVSQGAEFERLRAFSRTAGLDRMTTFLPPRVGTELYELLRTMHVGIGTIARYRVGLDTDSSLKTREYCAFGIPQVLSATDRSFPPDLPFVWYVANDDSELDVATLVSWQRKLRATPDWQCRLLRHADERLSWRGQLRRALRVGTPETSLHE